MVLHYLSSSLSVVCAVPALMPHHLDKCVFIDVFISGRVISPRFSSHETALVILKIF